MSNGFYDQHGTWISQGFPPCGEETAAGQWKLLGQVSGYSTDGRMRFDRMKRAMRQVHGLPAGAATTTATTGTASRCGRRNGAPA